MVSINIKNGQGLTLALKNYAQSQNLDVSHISAKNWNNTVNKLKELQAKRMENNEESIYKGNNMTVSAGTKNFSDTEISELFEAMGLKFQKSSELNDENLISRPKDKIPNQVQSQDLYNPNPFSNSNNDLVWGANWGIQIQNTQQNTKQTINHETEIEDITYSPDGKKLSSEFYGKAKWNYSDGTIYYDYKFDEKNYDRKVIYDDNFNDKPAQIITNEFDENGTKITHITNYQYDKNGNLIRQTNHNS